MIYGKTDDERDAEYEAWWATYGVWHRCYVGFWPVTLVDGRKAKHQLVERRFFKLRGEARPQYREIP